MDQVLHKIVSKVTLSFLSCDVICPARTVVLKVLCSFPRKVMPMIKILRARFSGIPTFFNWA